MLDNNDIVKLGEVFATKEYLQEVRNDIVKFKDEILTGQDEILGKLDILLQEKTTGDTQDKRKTNVLKIHNNALKRNKILAETEVSEIDNLRAF